MSTEISILNINQMLQRRQDGYQFVCMGGGVVFSVIFSKTLINQDSINTNFKFPEYSCYLLHYEKYSQFLDSLIKPQRGTAVNNCEDLGPKASTCLSELLQPEKIIYRQYFYRYYLYHLHNVNIVFILYFIDNSY